MFKRIFISKKAQKHASRGDFRFSRDGKHEYKMISGGHGQENMDYLSSRKIPFFVSYSYPNGVRRGNISIHKRGKCRTGDQQCWFPSSWSREDIATAGRYVMSLKRNKKRKDGKTFFGTHKRVRVGVKTKSGFISTIFPIYTQKGPIKYVKKGT